MSNEDDKVSTAVLAFFMIPVVVTWKGYVLSVLWSWFVSPLGVAEISIWHACGIAAVVSFLTVDTSAAQNEELTTGVKLFTSLFIPLLMLGFGAIYHSLMN